ncbi:MAG: hypothetical protein ACI8Z5_002682 [Lentimonas sp.]|jgi:hypothetical protein
MGCEGHAGDEPPELNAYLKDPVREGWSYCKDLWS